MNSVGGRQGRVVVGRKDMGEKTIFIAANKKLSHIAMLESYFRAPYRTVLLVLYLPVA